MFWKSFSVVNLIILFLTTELKYGKLNNSFMYTKCYFNYFSQFQSEYHFLAVLYKFILDSLPCIFNFLS